MLDSRIDLLRAAAAGQALRGVTDVPAGSGRVAAVGGEIITPRPVSAERVEAISTQEMLPSVARALRQQALRYELNANDGRYCSNSRVAVKKDDRRAHPMQYIVVPMSHPGAGELFGATDDPETARLRAQLFRNLPDPRTGKLRPVLLMPVHWEELEVLRKQYPDLEVLKDGAVHRTASPRSLLFGVEPKQLPQLVDLERYSVKTHLSAEAYTKIGGLGGSRELNANDSKMATLITHALEQLLPELSPYFAIQREAHAVVARLPPAPAAKPGEAAKTDEPPKPAEPLEIGALLRSLPGVPTVPAFALYSKTTERLPHVPDAGVGLGRFFWKSEERYLAVDAVRYFREKNPGVSAEDAFIKLFVDPVYDVIFSLARQGWTMELHSQNFQFEFDAKTGATKKLHIRDLHGTGYNKALRESFGKKCSFDLEELRKHFKDVTQEDIDGWFLRDGKLRPRYQAPQMFQNTLDFFSAIFFYHLLDAVQAGGLFGELEVSVLIERIKDRVEHFARVYEFDLKQLTQPDRSPDKTSFWVAKQKGIRGRILFRRPMV